ncbi:MAG TPA: DUF6502 family protein [Gammaproteobacteria bacterium]|nr:DUF6502 family protein [Gammaproteobacteria bacterium]
MSSVMSLDQDHLDLKRTVVALTVKVLRPLIRLLLRHGLSSQEFTEISRWLYVDLAMEENEFHLAHRKPTKSRAAVLTGLSRKEVMRLRETPTPEENEAIKSYNRAARVLTGWTQDPMFKSGNQPKVLSITGKHPSFKDLVKQHSGDMPYRAVLDELEHSGVVQIIDDESVKLRKSAYIPCAGSEQELDIIGTCAGDLLSTMEYNSRVKEADKKPQKQVYSLTIPEDKLPQLRDWVNGATQDFVDKTNREISNQADMVQTPARYHHRAGVGVYYFEV